MNETIPEDNGNDLAARICAAGKVREVRISRDGRHVVYQDQYQYKPSDSAGTHADLWVAEFDAPDSARPLAKANCFHGSTVFHPDGKRIVFLSDRDTPGKAASLYSLEYAVDGPETEPKRIKTDGKTVQGFDISPNGEYIAFLSPAEAPDEYTARIKTKDDARVYSEKTGLARIMLYEFVTGITRPLEGVRSDMHVESFTWSPNSKQILYRLRENKGPEYAEMPIICERIDITGAGKPLQIATYPRSPAGQSIWLGSGHIADLHNHVPSNTLDARTLFVTPVDEPFSPTGTGSTKRLYGDVEDAVRIVNMEPGDDNSEQQGFIAVEVCNDLDTHIDVVTCSKDNQVRRSVRLFETKDDAVWFSAWDTKRLVEAETGQVSYAFATILSSAIRHEPLNAYTFRINTDGGLINRVKVSSHLQWLADTPKLRTENVRWIAKDGTRLSGVVRYPSQYESGKLPTVLFLHGGPYRRMIPDYMPYFCNWREMFAWSGYLVISPNYRGSQGRGHDFASASALGVGVLDWEDCDSMVDELVNRGLVDPGRMAVAGWSHGGSIAAWGVTETKTRFKAAIIGAGATNWEGMVMESGSPELEGAIGGSIPWKDFDKFIPTSERKTSPVHSVGGVTTACLILHGDRDERVPLGQSIGFWRGLKRCAAQRGKDGAELVVYPREPHGFVERKHAEDVLRRSVAFLNKWC
ncbi:Peptidase-S9 domain-containing protein [Mycena indigotica]|uniref:Dipeptidyl-peptidase V n=1 Tax=Mycena indigotica TaxID=2126181 RepID=A0A8H6TC36_9AGAR|nr:Peptidase-S9 domain-containing protein [Mycena indigotica]KAF7315808.1 Peptidase-S9 domain-containing protein [Mycena indigotica]